MTGSGRKQTVINPWFLSFQCPLSERADTEQTAHHAIRATAAFDETMMVNRKEHKRDVLALLVAGVVACATFFVNLIFVALVIVPLGPVHGGDIAVVIVLIWSLAIPIVAALFAFRLVAPQERLCDVCEKPIPNDAVDWMHRIGKDGEASLWVPTHVDCSTENHRVP